MQGQEIYKKSQQLDVRTKLIEINVSQFKNGLYLLVFKTPMEEFIRKIEIN